MARGFETGSDNEKIDELQRQLDDINDSQINSVGGNENISIDSTRGSRNDAAGDSGGVRSSEPVIHQITDVDEGGSSTGVFDKINLISSMIIVDYVTPAVDIELRFIQGTAKDGVINRLTPKEGRTLVVKSGGNILTSSDITISDTEIYEVVKFSEAETGVTGGAYKIFSTTSSSAEFFGPWTANHDASNQNLIGLNTLDFFQAGQSIQNKADPDGGLLYNVADLQSHIFRANSDEIARFSEVAAGVFRLDMLDHSIDNAQDIRFDDTSGVIVYPSTDPAIGFDSVASRLLINMPTGANLFVTNNNVIGSLQMNNNSITANIVNANDVLQLGVDATAPTVVGEFRSNGTDVRVFSGGAIRNLSNIGSGTDGEFFGPWTGAHDADGFNLNNIEHLQFNDAVATSAATREIYGSAGGDLHFNVAATDDHIFTVNDVDVLTLGDGLLDIHSNVLSDVLNLRMTAIGTSSGGSVLEIYGVAAFDMHYNVANASFHIFHENNTETFRIGDSAVTLALDVDLIVGGRLLRNLATDTVATGTMTLTTNGDTINITGSTGITNIVTTGFQAGAHITLKFDGAPLLTNDNTGSGGMHLAGATNFQTVAEDVITFFLNDDDDWYETSRNGAVGGGEVFTWTADHSAAGFNLTNLGNTIFDNASALTGAGVTEIYSDGTALFYNVPTADIHSFRVNNVAQVSIDSAGIIMADAKNIVIGTTTGTKWGTSNLQKQAWWNATPIVQPSHIADPSGGATVDAEARTAINSILAQLATLGLQAAS